MWLGNAVTSSTLHTDPPSNETIDVFYIKISQQRKNYGAPKSLWFRRWVQTTWFICTYLSIILVYQQTPQWPNQETKRLTRRWVIAAIILIINHIHSVFCLMTGPKPPPKRCLHTVRSRASSFKWEYPVLSLRSSGSFLRLLPRLLVTSISPFIFPSISCFRRQFLRKM